MDEDTRAYEYAKGQLKDWAKACHNAEDAVGFSPVGGLAATIQHVQAETRRRNSARREISTALRRARKAWKEGDPPIDPKLVAQALGYTDPMLTAQGADTRSAQLAKITLDTRIMNIDGIVAKLPSWQRKCIWRSFYYRQRDSKAAEQLRMPRPQYTSRRRAAVYAVAEKLGQATCGATKRGSESRRTRSDQPQAALPKTRVLPRRPILSIAKHRK